PAHHALISDPDVMYYIQDVFSRSFAESLSTLAGAAAGKYDDPAERNFLFLVIADPETENYMGGIGYSVLERSPAGKRVEPGYFLQKQYWGRGYASEALAELLRYAFEEDDVRRVDMTCVADNVRSARVMENCGLVFEGERRGYEWHVDSVKSRRYYGILKEEWEEQHKR
ncbi:MAG: GNAT family N-acetyltransferase, partial [Firmicutes bacterium]|nr:GNAT family N-acetyltransferase [Bacillota bacterium]